MKIIKVEGCRECPYAKHYCLKMKELLTPKIIDDECPLEDAQDLTPALDILQKYINRGDSLKKWKDGQYKLSGLEGVIVEGASIKELLINLFNLDKGIK